MTSPTWQLSVKTYHFAGVLCVYVDVRVCFRCLALFFVACKHPQTQTPIHTHKHMLSLFLTLSPSLLTVYHHVLAVSHRTIQISYRSQYNVIYFSCSTFGFSLAQLNDSLKHLWQMSGCFQVLVFYLLKS